VSDGGAQRSDEVWRQVLATDFAKAAWLPLAGDPTAHPGLAGLLGQLAAHAAVYAALARQWADRPRASARHASPAVPSAATPAQTPSLRADSPILAMQRSLLQPWLALIEGADGCPRPGPKVRANRAFGWDIEALLGRLPDLAGQPDGPRRLAEVRQAVLAFLAAWHDYLAMWGDIMNAALARLGSPPGKADAAPGSLRAAYDRWVDISEQIYAARAITPEFAQTQGRLINAYVHLCQHERALRPGPGTRPGAPRETAEPNEWKQAIAELHRRLEQCRNTLAVSSDAPGTPATAADADPPAPGGPRATV